MIQEDYVMRLINILGKILGKVLSDLLSIKNLDELNLIIIELEQDLYEKLNLDLHKLKNIQSLDEIQILFPESTINIEQLEILGSIFTEITSKCIQFHHEESKKYVTSSIVLLEYLESSSRTFSNSRQKQLDSLKLQLKDL